MFEVTVKEDEDYACGEPICEPDTEKIYLIGCPDLTFEQSIELLSHEYMHEAIFRITLGEHISAGGEWDSNICNRLEDWIWKRASIPPKPKGVGYP